MRPQATLRRLTRVIGVGILVLSLIGCAPNWKYTLRTPTGEAHVITRETWQQIARLVPSEQQDALPLERVLWHSGITAVDSIEVEGNTFPWFNVRENAWLLANGKVRIDQQVYEADEIQVVPPEEAAQASVRLVDLTATIAGALQVRSPKQTMGRSLGNFRVRHVVVVAVDGLGYRRYQQVRGERITPLLDSLGTPRIGLTVYPSVPQVALAALVTGATPERNGVLQPDMPLGDADTIFDALTEANKTSLVVHLAEPVLELPATTTIGPDGTGDALPGEATLQEALSIIEEQMPDFVLVHMGGLEPVARDYGVQSDEEKAALTTIDSRIHTLLTTLPSDTLLLIVGSHGLHGIAQDNPTAESGSLLAPDMFVPLWVVQL